MQSSLICCPLFSLGVTASAFQTDTSLPTIYMCDSSTGETILTFRESTHKTLHFSLGICVDLLFSKILKPCRKVVRLEGDMAWRCFSSSFSLEAGFFQMKLMPSSGHFCEYIYMQINDFLRKKILNSNSFCSNEQEKILGEEGDQLGEM